MYSPATSSSLPLYCTHLVLLCTIFAVCLSSGGGWPLQRSNNNITSKSHLFPPCRLKIRLHLHKRSFYVQLIRSEPRIAILMHMVRKPRATRRSSFFFTSTSIGLNSLTTPPLALCPRRSSRIRSSASTKSEIRWHYKYLSVSVEGTWMGGNEVPLSCWRRNGLSAIGSDIICLYALRLL